VSVQNLATVQVIALACTSVGRCQFGAAAALRTAARERAVQRTGGAGAPGGAEVCAGGGTKLETCINGVWTVVFTDCVEPAAGATNERSGTAVLTVADPAFCDDLAIDPLASVALELQDYRHVERDAQGAEVARLEADWLETLTPTARGCQLASDTTQLADGFHEVSGTLHVECGAGSRTVPCPRGSMNLTLRTSGLQMRRESAGSPCELRLQLIGTVAVDDRERSLDGRSCRMQFTQTFSNFLLAEAPLGDGTSTVRQSGRMTVDQFGPLDVATLPPGGAGSLFVDAMDCPTGGDGALEIRRPAEAPGEAAPTVRFQQGTNGDPQVVFDFTGGDVETVSGCIGISPLTSCE
jgi:hypothetical protein